MVRTTPPRPIDVTTYFPELAPLGRTAIRLHPRPGRPTASDSSVGGPLLWPAEEPWPTCGEHAGPWHVGFSPEDVRLRRRILATAWSRPRLPGTDLLTGSEHEVMDRIGLDGARIAQDGPLAMLPVAQVYASDVPELPRPDGTDLLQVLWCPFDHEDDGLPRTLLRWRSAAEVHDPIAAAPQPSVIGEEEYLPEPCVVHPEPVTEYPAPLELPPGLRQQVLSWESRHGVVYQYDLGVAPGWKIGGWAPWSFSDPTPLRCPECDAGVQPLLTVDSTEWDGGSHSWRPAEETAADNREYPGASEPTMVTIGRSYCLQLYVCPVSRTHPHVQNMQ